MEIGLSLSLTSNKGVGDPFAGLHTDGLIAEWRFAERSGTTVKDQRGSNDINLATPTSPNATWTSKGVITAAGLVQTPTINSSRTRAVLYRVGRGEAAGFMLSGGPAGSGSGVIADSVTASYRYWIGVGRGVRPIVYAGGYGQPGTDGGALPGTNGQGANIVNRGGWVLVFEQFSAASNTIHGFGGRHSTTTSRCTDFEIAWAGIYNDTLTDAERLTIYTTMRNVAKARGFYIDWRDCPTKVDAVLNWGESTSDGRGTISSLTAPDQARTISRTYIMRNAATFDSAPALMLVGTNQQTSNPAAYIGPQVPVAWRREDNYAGRNLYVAHSGQGTTYLAPASSGAPVTANVSWNPAEVVTGAGRLWQALRNWNDLEQNLLLNGIGPELKALFLTIGLNDMTSTAFSANYDTHLQSLYDATQLYTGATGLRAVLGRPHPFDPAANATAAAEIRTKMATFIAANAQTSLIDMDGYPLEPDGVHQNGPGVKTYGYALSDAVF